MSGVDTVADGELLEFLGSVDGEGEGWGEYLEDADLRRAAAVPRAPAAPPPAVPPPAARPPAAPPPAAQPPVKPPARAPQPESQP